MINQRSIQAVDQSTFSSQFRLPLYDSYCFSNLPQTILSFFGIGKPTLPNDTIASFSPQYKKVVLFFIDSFGWDSYQRQLPTSPLLQQLEQKGIVSKLTSQFPSTTAAHVTTLNTGMTVGEHGVYEWNYFEPKLQAVIHPLLYSYAGDKTRNSISDSSLDPSCLFPKNTIHQQLRAHNIPSHSHQPNNITDGHYSQAMLNGSVIHGYRTFTEGLVNLSHQVITESTGYYYFYYSEFDTITHDYGSDSSQADAQIQLFLHALEKYFFKQISPETLVILTADHGHINVSSDKCFYINLDVPEVIPYLKTLPNQQPIIPAGSPQDFFLHVKESKLELTKSILTEKLQGKAEVYRVQDLINQGFFGPTCSSTFLSRVGNLVIASYTGHSAWWFEEGKFSQHHHANHGGLTPQEMDIPLIIYQSS